MKTFFKNIKALFFTRDIEKKVLSPSQVIDSRKEETANEYKGNKEIKGNYENLQIYILDPNNKCLHSNKSRGRK